MARRPQLTSDRSPSMSGLGFWTRAVFLLLLLLGTVDALLLLMSRGAIAFAVVTGGGGAVFLGGYLLTLCFAPTTAALLLWLVRSVRGWILAQRGAPSTVVSDGTPGWRHVSVALASVNALVAVMLLVVAWGQVLEPARTWSAIACAACNVWVCLYYRPTRRWDGKVVWGSERRPATGL